MNKSSYITLAVIIIILVLAGWYTYLVKTKNAQDSVNEISNKIFQTDTVEMYTDINGNQINFDTFSGKPLVVNSWATWCPFCQNELKILEKLAEKYNNDVVFLAVNRKEDVRKVIDYLDSLGTFSHIKIILDVNDSYYASIDGFTMPETVFYDKKGDIVFHKRGSMSLPEMEKYLKDALNSSF